MKIASWLKANGDAIKTAASVLQSVVVIGGIYVADHAFILSGKVEERERVRNTIPFLEKANLPEFQEARARFDEAQYVFMSADMAGRDDRSPDYKNSDELAALERKTGRNLVRLAAYYEMLDQCISASICSERALRHALCRDATQLHDDLTHLKRVLELRYKNEKFQMLTPHAQDRVRIYASLRGLETFAKGCHSWNEHNPRDKALLSDGPRRAPL